MGIFGSKNKKPKVNQHDKAVLDLKTQRDKLKQYQKKCEQVMNRETEIAKTLLKEGKKKQAVLALKKKKYQETLLEKSTAQLDNLQQMIDSVEFAQMEQKVFEGLKAGNEVLKDIHAQMTVEDVENLMLETEEAIAYQNEIDQLLSGKLTSEDEDAIMEEYEALEKSTLEASLPDVATDELPDVEVAEPSKTKATPAKKKEAQMVPG